MSPVTPQDVKILISPKAGANFEFANPRTNYGLSLFSPPPSFFDIQSDDTLDINGTMGVMGDSGSSHPERYGLNFGERIVSLRNILHRVCLAEVVPATASSATAAVGWYKSLGRNLTSFGFDPNGSTTAVKALTAGNAPINFDVTHPITYVSWMFGGFRGSYNVVITPSADLTPYIGDIRVERIGDDGLSTLHVGTNYWSYNTGDTLSAKLRYSNSFIPWTLSGGGAVTNTLTNGSVQVNWPYMSGFNFQYPAPAIAGPTSSTDGSNRESLAYHISFKQNGAGSVTERATITTLVGTGPDFTCLWWLCCPTVDYYVDLPAST
jgi:hypothetical protein